MKTLHKKGKMCTFRPKTNRAINLAVENKNDIVPTFKLNYLSQEEIDEVVVVLGERLKNTIYEMAEAQVASGLTQLTKLTDIRGTDTININFNMSFVWMDIVEIVGGLRRKKGGS